MHPPLLRPRPTHDESPNSHATYGNATQQRDIRHRDTETRRTTARHGNTPNEDAPNEDAIHGNATHGNATYGNAPNKHATVPNEAPRNHTPATVTTSRVNEYPRKNPHNPARRHLNEGTRTNCRTCELEYGSSTPHPLQRVWGTTKAHPMQDDNPRNDESPNSDVPHGNATWQCDTRQHDTPTRHSNGPTTRPHQSPQQRAKRGHGITHSPRQGTHTNRRVYEPAYVRTGVWTSQHARSQYPTPAGVGYKSCGTKRAA
ncbi:hypothetical protein BS47DRAFT_1370128 [Hydnum rufescens UP504]|uniref:Uncharacterized protein n=1 Tax=Hydnum rufescens UP504 TaxID=1448309 RepID=A0A9P6ABY8_9AGAM|nr:hypothetical protein BS47DRAFT_1370128 [Hydnum rufescens UP504]